jgi:hypothetical protein
VVEEALAVACVAADVAAGTADVAAEAGAVLAGAAGLAAGALDVETELAAVEAAVEAVAWAVEAVVWAVETACPAAEETPAATEEVLAAAPPAGPSRLVVAVGLVAADADFAVRREKTTATPMAATAMPAAQRQYRRILVTSPLVTTSNLIRSGCLV